MESPKKIRLTEQAETYIDWVLQNLHEAQELGADPKITELIEDLSCLENRLKQTLERLKGMSTL